MRSRDHRSRHRLFFARAGVKDILLVDERPPLSFTCDRSTECYRNKWPDPVMLALMNRYIDLMEELTEQSGNVFQLPVEEFHNQPEDADSLLGSSLPSMISYFDKMPRPQLDGGYYTKTCENRRL